MAGELPVEQPRVARAGSIPAQPTERMCYVGIMACGCPVAVIVDDPPGGKGTAQEVSRFIKQGYTVERKTVQWARENLHRCVHESAVLQK